MAPTAPSMQRAVLALLALVIAVLLATGIVGAVKVGNHHASHVATAPGQPSSGQQLSPGAVPETSTSEAVQSTFPTVLPVVTTATTQPVTVPTTAIPRSTTTTSLTTTTGATCTASVSNSTPQPGQRETVAVTSDLDLASVSVTVHYASGDASYRAKTSGSGQAQVSFNVPPRELPGQVLVDVLVGPHERCQTGFTVV